jgi:hypothetical protein
VQVSLLQLGSWRCKGSWYVYAPASLLTYCVSISGIMEGVYPFLGAVVAWGICVIRGVDPGQHHGNKSSHVSRCLQMYPLSSHTHPVSTFFYPSSAAG